jgi:hypothetical protein
MLSQGFLIDLKYSLSLLLAHQPLVLLVLMLPSQLLKLFGPLLLRLSLKVISMFYVPLVNEE